MRRLRPTTIFGPAIENDATGAEDHRLEQRVAAMLAGTKDARQSGSCPGSDPFDPDRRRLSMVLYGVSDGNHDGNDGSHQRPEAAVDSQVLSQNLTRAGHPLHLKAEAR